MCQYSESIWALPMLGTKQAQLLFWCSFFKSPKPHISARYDSAFHFNNEYTMGPLPRNSRRRTELSPQLSRSANHFSLSDFPSLLLIVNVDLPGFPECQVWRPTSFSHSLRTCFQWQLCCVLRGRPSAHPGGCECLITYPIGLPLLD